MEAASQILMVSSEVHPLLSTGGLGVAVARLAGQLVALGAHVQTIIPGGRGRVELVHQEGQQIVRLPVDPCGIEQSVSKRNTWLLQFAEAVCEYVPTISSYNCVILHDNETACCARALRKRGVRGPLLYWMHSLYDYPATDSESPITDAIESCDIVVTSRGVLEDATELAWPFRLRKVQAALIKKASEGGVTCVSALGCINRKHIILGNLPICNDPTLMFAGRCTYTKGFGFVLDLSSELNALGVRMQVTGDPPAVVGAECKVKWLGWLDREELVVERSRSRCIVSPSLTEGFGLSVAEALNEGCRVVAFPVGGLRDMAGMSDLELVPLEVREREELYSLWGEMLGCLPEARAVWERRHLGLRSTKEKLMEVVSSVVGKTYTSSSRLAASPFEPANEWGKNVLRLVLP